MIRYRRSLNHKLCRLGIGGCYFYDPIGTLLRNHKSLGSGGSMVARLKLKGIDGKAHKEWNLRLNLTQHGKTHQVRIRV